jgi:hypothetical protein
MVTRRCYQMVIVATDEDTLSPEPVAIESHSSNERFSDIGATVETDHKVLVAIVESPPPPSLQTFCSSV